MNRTIVFGLGANDCNAEISRLKELRLLGFGSANISRLPVAYKPVYALSHITALSDVHPGEVYFTSNFYRHNDAEAIINRIYLQAEPRIIAGTPVAPAPRPVIVFP